MSIAFALLRYSEEFQDTKSKTKAYELLDVAMSKPAHQTGLRYYAKYGYYDPCICHGTSSIAYMYKKMYYITGDASISDEANKWINLTLEGMDTYLPQMDKIAKNEKNNPHIDTSIGFLNGLSGVGLALQTYLNPNLSSWDKLLLLDRPGRE